MANEMIQFLRGSIANLPQSATPGALYFTKDEGVYLGLEDGSYHRYGDFIIVDAVANLPDSGAHATCMYYCVAENILAKYDSANGWVQINKQPTAEEMKTLLGLGSAAYTDASAYDTAGSAAAVRTYVGDIPVGEDGQPVAASVVAYINKKTDGIATSGNLEALGARVTTAEGEIDALQEASAKHVEKVEGKSLIADSEITRLAGMSDGANKVENVGGGKIKIDGVEAVVYAHPEKHSISEVDGLQDALDDKVVSVTAGDTSVTVGGTATAPTVAAKISAAEGNALTLAEDGLKVILPESTKVEASETNGNIKVDGEEVTVYVHPDKHAIADVTGLEDALAGKQDVIPEGTYDAYGSAAQALTDAKAYVDEEDKFVTDILTVDKFGGIAAGSDLNGMTTHEILNQLLYPYIAFTLNSTSRSAAAATLENGATQTLSSASISITKKSKPITSVKLLNGSTVLGEKTGADVAAGGTIKFEGLGITVSKDNNPNLKFTVTDGTTSTDKNVGASTFVYPYYMGSCAADATIDETLIEGLTKKVESKGNKTVTYDCAQERMVIAYPKAHGVLKSIIDPNNFETIDGYTRSEVTVTGLDSTAQVYYVYASAPCTASGFKVQFKY